MNGNIQPVHEIPFKPVGISHRYNWNRPFLTISVIRLKGMFGSIFHFHSNFNRTFCKQTVRTLIKRIVRRLIWYCTVCLCPTKKTLGLYGLNCFGQQPRLRRDCASKQSCLKRYCSHSHKRMDSRGWTRYQVDMHVNYKAFTHID